MEFHAWLCPYLASGSTQLSLAQAVDAYFHTKWPHCLEEWEAAPFLECTYLKGLVAVCATSLARHETQNVVLHFSTEAADLHWGQALSQLEVKNGLEV